MSNFLSSSQTKQTKMLQAISLIFIVLLLIIAICILIVWNFGKTLEKPVTNLHLSHRLLSNQRYLFQTYKSKSVIPRKVAENINRFANNFQRILFDDQDCISFLEKHFPSVIAFTFKQLHGGHKGDLFRYCILYLYGGVYMDIKTELLSPLDNILPIHSPYIYTVINYAGDHIYQGIIATPPSQEIFPHLIEKIVQTGGYPTNYHQFCRDFYDYIKQDIGQRPRFGTIHGKSHSYYLLREVCSSNPSDCCDTILDRHGLCCNVYDGNKKVIHTRYSDFGRTW